jgi:hypothetical protein
VESLRERKKETVGANWALILILGGFFDTPKETTIAEKNLGIQKKKTKKKTETKTKESNHHRIGSEPKFAD